MSVLELFVSNAFEGNLSAVLPQVVGAITRCLHIPIVEISVASCDLISCLAAAQDGNFLSQDENMVLLLLSSLLNDFCF